MDHAKTPPGRSRGTFPWLILILVLAVAGIILYWPKIFARETDIFVKLQPVNIPSDLTITGTHSQGLDVRLRGAGYILKNLSENKLVFKLDLSDANPGHHIYKIDPDGLVLPPNVRLVRFEPSTVALTLAKRMKKTVPVSVTLAGNPAEGYQVIGAIAYPLSVELGGPETILQSTEKVNTKPVDISGARESFKKEATLELAEGLKILSPLKVLSAEIFISETVKTKKIENIPVSGKNTPYDAVITPGVIAIEVKGPGNTLEQLDSPEDIEVFVDLKGLKPGVYARRATITLPLEMTLVGVHPEIFTVTLKPK